MLLYSWCLDEGRVTWILNKGELGSFPTQKFGCSSDQRRLEASKG